MPEIPNHRNASRGLSRRDLLATLGGLGIASLLPAACSGDIEAPPKAVESAIDWRDRLGGTVVCRGESDYEMWRSAMPWQGWVSSRQPQCIVRPHNREQLSAALAHARENGLRIALRSGGHNVAESFLREGGMLVDLEEFREFSVDTGSASAWAGPSLWSRDLMLGLAQAGLAFPVAHCATVPMGGYLLGGGIGINTDEWGVACHSVTGAEVMLADGSVVQASASANPDLFWALRGAGTGFFGVVLRYHLACRTLPRDTRESIYAFPIARAAEVAQWLTQLAAAGMPGVELMLLLAHNPQAGADAPPEHRVVCIARAVAFGDSEAHCAGLLRAISGSPIAASAAMRMEMQPTTIDRMMIGSVDAARGLGFGRSAVNTIWTDDAGAAVGRAASLMLAAPSALSHFVISPRHDTRLREDASFSRIARCFVGCYAVWRDAADDQSNFDWVDRVNSALDGFAAGQYINEIDAFRYPQKVPQSFSAEAFERLHSLRKRYDPSGLFHSWPGQESI